MDVDRPHAGLFKDQLQEEGGSPFANTLPIHVSAKSAAEIALQAPVKVHARSSSGSPKSVRIISRARALLKCSER